MFRLPATTVESSHVHRRKESTVTAKTATKHEDGEKKRAKAREEFYRIVKTRLDMRIAKRESYTTTRDLYAGYEKLHHEGFGDTPPSQTVAQVLGQRPYRDRLYYARNVVTHKAERSGPGRTAPYRIYLRDDATPPRDYVLVPLSTPRDRIAQVVAEKKGALDATVHVTTAEQPATHETPGFPVFEDSERLIGELTRVIETQAALIASLTPLASRRHAA
jgi:hypothetical protein